MSAGMAAYGTILQIGAVNVAEVNSISGPSLSLDPIEITHHESVDAFKEFVGGLLDGGEVTLDVNFLPTDGTQAKNTTGSLIYAMLQRSVETFTVIWPDTTEWAFEALVTGFEPSASVDDKLAASITLKCTGPVTIPGEPES